MDSDQLLDSFYELPRPLSIENAYEILRATAWRLNHEIARQLFIEVPTLQPDEHILDLTLHANGDGDGASDDAIIVFLSEFLRHRLSLNVIREGFNGLDDQAMLMPYLSE